MRFIELFAGLGGLGYGLMQAGMKCVGFVECDTQCMKCKTYTQHQPHPDKEYTTVCQTCGTSKTQPTHMSYQMLHDPRKEMWSAYDVTTVTDDTIRGLRDRKIELIAAGFPCQAFSVAGKREGFADQTRGTLFFEVVRFASILRPKHLLLENVDGLRNHDGGRTLGIILSTLDEMGYVGEWEVLNSSAYIPQNRERIFIVASLRGSSARKIFPIGQENSSAIEVVGRLEGNHDQNCRVYGIGGVAPTLSTMQGGGQEPKVMVAGHLACDSGGTGKVYDPNGIAPTQLAQHGNAVTKIKVVGTTLQTDAKGTNSRHWVYDEKGIMGCLSATDYKQPKQVLVRAILTPDRPEKRQNGRRMKEPGEPMFTLTAQDKHGVAIQQSDLEVIDMYNKKKRADGNIGTLTANGHTSFTHTGTFGIYNGYRIRKLTPLECFRLQTWPDEWYVKLKLFRHPELIPLVDMSRNDITAQVLNLLDDGHPVTTRIFKEGISDSQLYKMAGNGVTSAVSYDIGIRLMEVSA